MSFWSVSNGEISSTGEFEIGGELEPIPDGTNLKACIDEIGWESWEENTYIKARWTVLDGEYKGRKIYQKIRAQDSDQSKRDKAIRMLAAIDANCGGRLMQSGQMPDDGMMQGALCNIPMVIKVAVWEINEKSGNWVSMVSRLPGAQPGQPAQRVQQAQPAQTQPWDNSEDIPF
jgi:hypothetical protein